MSGLGKAGEASKGRGGMSCGHEFTLGTHDKLGTFSFQRDRFELPANERDGEP
jgi:hypothetical protein